jgi:cob(I)alamin adenosyltransferase
VARTVARQAERSGWAAYAEHGDTMNVVAIRYLNRLSDLLFVLARHANRHVGDVLWKPGGDHLR